MNDNHAAYALALSERVTEVQTQRAALVAAIEETRVARSLTFADDEHDPDGSTASLDQVRDSALLQRTEQTLTELTEAQARLASGGYGVCEVCGREVSTERMLARPETRFCVPCLSRVDARQRGRGG